MEIRHTPLKHGWFYHYRFHALKAGLLCGEEFSALNDFMNKMLTNCPDHYFESGPRSSALRFEVNTAQVRVDGHEVCSLAAIALRTGRYKTAHSNVEVYMLENDSCTLAVELPIWLQPHELSLYKTLFESEETLTGHIDILRVEDSLIWIWDYKPDAEKERFAACQTLFYALMLSKRTGISLDKFRCGYFDDKTSFIFQPKLEHLPLRCTISK